MYLCFRKSCKSKILESEVEQNTPICSTRTLLRGMVALVALAQSKQAGSRQMEGAVFYVAGLISRRVRSFMYSFSTIIHIFLDCPQNVGPLTNRGSGTGANSAPTGPSQWGASRDKNSWRDRDDDGTHNGGWEDNQRLKDERRERPPVNDIYRSRDDRSGRRRSRSRSRSPYGSRQSDSVRGRRRSYSRERSAEREYRDKRRRID